MRKPGPIAPRFWSKVDKSSGPDTCWPWTGCRTKQGYGHFRIGQGNCAMRTAHSVALELQDGSRPEGMYALHSCDNPSCCNPAHLRWGTHDENMKDKSERHSFDWTVGERHHGAKLTDEIVRELRRRYKPRHPVDGARAMAREFGMSLYPITRAISGNGWRHV